MPRTRQPSTALGAASVTRWAALAAVLKYLGWMAATALRYSSAGSSLGVAAEGISPPPPPPPPAARTAVEGAANTPARSTICRIRILDGRPWLATAIFPQNPR